MMAQQDPRRVVRGKCLMCDVCPNYAAPAPGAGLKCTVCNHPPGRHQRLKDTSGNDLCDVAPAPSLTTTQESDSEEDTTLAVTCCTFKGCNNPVDFDPNTGEESSFCEEHADYVSAQAAEIIRAFQSLHLSSEASKICAIQGCSRQCFVDEQGKTHECCGYSHALEHQRRVELLNSMAGITHCLLPECDRLTWPFKNYCSREHARTGKQRQLKIPVEQKDSSHCIIPECFRQKCTENGIAHDYCSKYCARDAEQRNIRPTTEDRRKQCELGGCKNFRKKTKTGSFFDYCCKEHANQDAVSRVGSIDNPLKTMEEIQEFIRQFPKLSSAKIHVEENPHAQPGGKLFALFQQARSTLDPSRRNTCLAFHGTDESNVYKIFEKGYDPSRRGSNIGQVHGKGEYFSSTPDLALRYCKGNGLILNELLLGEANKDHTKSGDIIVMKNPEHDLPRLRLKLV